jgi:hypothetical protein
VEAMSELQKPRQDWIIYDSGALSVKVPYDEQGMNLLRLVLEMLKDKPAQERR